MSPRATRALTPFLLMLATIPDAKAASVGAANDLVVAAESVPPAAPLGLFVLPVEGGPGLSRDARRLLEARVAVALGRCRRVRALGPRDLPRRARGLLPAEAAGDLAACVTPGCLRVLGAETGAAHVLGLELLDDGVEGVLFATLFDARTGAILGRRELAPLAAGPATRQWADEVARWVVVAAGAQPQDPMSDGARAAAGPDLVEPVLVIDAGPNPTTEARALVEGLRGRLIARGRPRLAPPGTTPPVVTHRAAITVERVAVSQRQHHLHHDRTAVLAATLTITDARSGAVVFTDAASSQFTARARDAPELALTGVLADDVAARWMAALEAQSIDRILNPIAKRGQP